MPAAPISLALCGDVMCGRGVDQILPHPGDRALHESDVRDAWDYVRLAMNASGIFPTPVDFAHIWGDALEALAGADVRIANLETSLTAADAPWPAKGIHYRMHPENIGCLTVARIDCCGLANNHVIDWGYDGLTETMQTLRLAGIAFAGAGRDAAEAAAPAVIKIPGKARVIVLAIASPDSGIPPGWAATADKPGINVLTRLDAESAHQVAEELRQVSQPDDVTVVSLHAGGNWGYEIPASLSEFARALIDEGVDVVHGHSSHHAKAIELRRGGVIFYGCGDFINDYEGIGGNEEYRPDLALLCQVRIKSRPHRAAEVGLLPLQRRQMSLQRASASDAAWLCARLNAESAALGTSVQLQAGHRMLVQSRPSPHPGRAGHRPGTRPSPVRLAGEQPHRGSASRLEPHRPPTRGMTS